MTITPGDSRLPQHVAIIMDGNGRWAEMRGKSRLEGHREGVGAVKRTIEACQELQIPYLTLYAFSVENWKRPSKEIDALMDLLLTYITKELVTAKKKNIRLRFMGDRGPGSKLDPKILRTMIKAEEETADNTGLTVAFAVNYSGRDEIVRAAQYYAQEIESGVRILGEMDEPFFAGYLDSVRIPDPDLFIRTGGEMRLSNFMLWQSAYSELYFTKKLWPDFNITDLKKIIINFKKRKRNYGK